VGLLEWMLITLALLSFAAVVVLQALLPHWVHHPVVREMHVHVTNGFYLNTDGPFRQHLEKPRSKET
jgi:hypothetical protein